MGQDLWGRGREVEYELVKLHESVYPWRNLPSLILLIPPRAPLLRDHNGHPQIIGVSGGKLQYPSNHSHPRDQCPSSVGRSSIKTICNTT